MTKGLSGLDIKIGIRMLVKYPWLTVIGGLGMAVAVAIGASFFGIIYSMMDRTLPLPGGDRIVAIQNWSDSTRSPHRRIAGDFFFWRERVTTVEDVGAFYSVLRNLVTPFGEPEPRPVAQMSASGFRVAGIPAVIGRHLADADESPGAAPVAIIGEEIWRDGYREDPDVLQQSIQIGTESHRIVGVMPARFGWPLHHQVWVPLRIGPQSYEPGTGPILHAFGRLKPEVTLEQAQADLARIGRELAAAHPQTHAHLLPSVLPYTYPFVDVDNIRMAWAYHAIQISITLLLVLVCANVATLIYARTATRQGEIAVRTALGASRARIVGQLFVEALVLAVLASVAGIAIAKLALHQINIFFTESLGSEVPFWMRPEVSTGVIVYTVLVTILAATIIGAMPALKATGQRVQAQLRELGGGSGLLLGRTWTVLIVAQVAFAVMILPATLNFAWEFSQRGLSGPPFAADEFLFGILTREDPAADTASGGISPQFRRETSERREELMRRLRSDAAVAAATFSWRLPGQEVIGVVEVEGVAIPRDPVRLSSVGAGTRRGFAVRANRVDTTFFGTFGVSLVRGRTLNAMDFDADANHAVVNRTFVDRLLGGQNAIGRRFRYVGYSADADSMNAPLDRWFEIVGVVDNFPAREGDNEEARPRVYHPPLPDRTYMLTYLRLKGGADPEGYVSKFKQTAASVDPALQLSDVRNLRDELTEDQRMMRLGAIALITLTVSVLLLSAAGIYSMMSLTVNQRRREIGVRSALGAYPRNIMAAVFKRATRQLGAGVLLGVAAALLIDTFASGMLLQGRAPALVPLVAAIMATVGLLAALGPARRGLRIQPTEALREL